MELFNVNKVSENLSKGETEMVQQEKQEYHLIGTFLRTRGLIMYGYNHLTDKIFQVEIACGDTIHLIPIDGRLIPYDPEMEKCTVDSRFEYFEALNLENAEKRLSKYKKGLIFPLSNLKKANPDGIKFFNTYPF